MNDTPFDYMAEADKTCSTVFRPQHVDKSEFVNLLASFASIAEALNLRKKVLFRGKLPADVQLYHPPLHGSIAVEFDPVNTSQTEIDILHGCIGVITEAGEIAELLINRITRGKFDNVNVVEEAGDVMWYLARLGRGTNVTLDDVGRINIDKLHGRHGDTFNVVRDANRDLATERRRLENAATHQNADMFERSVAIDDDDNPTFGPCLGNNLYQPPIQEAHEPRAVWEYGCWRTRLVRDIPGLAT